MTSTTSAAANALRDFTRKWLPRFRDSRQNLHQLLDTGEFHADCAALGYMDDAGEAFDACIPAPSTTWRSWTGICPPSRTPRFWDQPSCQNGIRCRTW